MTPAELAFHNWQDGLDWDYSYPTVADNQLKVAFKEYVENTELSKNDKLLVKGVFYGFLYDKIK